MTDPSITPSDAPSTTDATDLPPADPEAAVGDAAAEMDAVEPADAPTDPDDSDPPPARFTGVCKGGPYDGRTVVSRFPGGFMLFDKARSLVWTYGTNPGDKSEFTSFGEGVAVTSTTESLIAAASGVQLDVIAYDDGPAIT